MRSLAISFFIFSYTQLIFAQELTTCGQLADEPPGCFLCQTTTIFENKGFTPEYPGQTYECGDIENNFWISIIPTETTVVIDIFSYNCASIYGIQYILYNQQLEPVSTCFSNFDLPSPLNAVNLIPGELYYLMVDGLYGDVCTNSIKLISGVYIPEAKTPQIKSPENIPDTVCIGESVCIELENQIPFVGFEWNTDFESDIQTFAKGQNACIRFTRPGLNEIEISSINPCNNPDTSVFVSIFVKSPGINSFLDTTICEGNCLEFYDSSFCNAGHHFYYHNDGDPENCGSVDLIKIDFLPNLNTNESREICKGDSTFWNGTYIFNQVNYTYHKPDSITGCDHIFELELNTKDTFYTNRVYEYNEGDILNGIVLTNDTTLVYNLSTVEGCDSTVIYRIQVKKSSTNSPDISKEPLTIFPNPNDGNFFISLKEKLNTETDITIRDLSGKIVYQEKKPKNVSQFDIRTKLSSGIYFLEISNSQNKWLKRIVVLD
ncbi:MAG: T9SS type A sorting domain-containing protein [Saprospiraceae bacterium]